MTPLTLTRTVDPQGRSAIKAVGEIDLSNAEAFASAFAGTTGPLIATSLLAPILEMSGLTSLATVRKAEK